MIARESIRKLIDWLRSGDGKIYLIYTHNIESQKLIPFVFIQLIDSGPDRLMGDQDQDNGFHVGSTIPIYALIPLVQSVWSAQTRDEIRLRWIGQPDPSSLLSISASQKDIKQFRPSIEISSGTFVRYYCSGMDRRPMWWFCVFFCNVFCIDSSRCYEKTLMTGFIISNMKYDWKMKLEIITYGWDDICWVKPCVEEAFHFNKS